MKTSLIVSLFALWITVACASEVQESSEVEVTRLVEVTRNVEVTRRVEVTREVIVPPAAVGSTLCADYPYITELGELQLGLFSAQVALGERAVSGPVEEQRAARDWFADRLQTTRRHQIEVCGGDFEPYGTVQREMRTFEGDAICGITLSLIRDTVNLNPDWDNAPSEMSEAVLALADGYDNYCDNDFVE